jgi:uncharacterized protein (DUF885 family)
MNSKVYNKYFDDLINLFPSMNDTLNLKQYQHLNHLQENAFSTTHEEKQLKFFNKYYELMNAKKNKNIYDKTIIYDCLTSIKSLKSNLKHLPINHQENIIIEIMETGSDNTILTLKTKKDYDNAINKLKSLEEITKSIISLMTQGIKKKVTLSKILTIKLIEQFKEFKKNSSYKNTKVDIKLPYDFNNEIKSLVVPSLDLIIHFLENIYLRHTSKSIGLCGLPNGKKLYSSIVSNSLTLNNINIKRIHDYGLKEVERINQAMNEIKNQFNFSGTLKEFAMHLKKQKENMFSSNKDVISYYKKHLNKINKTLLPKYFNNKVKQLDCEILPVPKFNEDFSSEAYYISGDIQNKRKGKFYINLKNFKELNKMEAEALVLHETNPGHHYQLTYVNENKNIPLFLKISSSEAYAEGWALYVENLGFYDSLESLFGKYINEMLRAVRLVVDTGIHYYDWSYKKTYDYCEKYLFDYESQIHAQVLRYMALPSQALCYKIGEKVILDLLKKEKSKPGFDVRVFHEKILENGAIPLFLLKEKFK